MIDKKTEAAIKSVKSFLEVWTQLHSMYGQILSRDIITKDDEDKFLSSKDMVAKKYSDLGSGLDFKYSPHGRFTDPVSDILAIDGIRFASEKSLKKIDDDWQDSYVFLNSILERLKSKKRRLGRFNPIGILAKKIFKKTPSQSEVG
ncbi:MAG: hypothetical protein KBB52_05465 [Candidatus Omnitrophica bacterium]|nr:hypothetical protein [Candidatus Omnitrophota bacterium]